MKRKISIFLFVSAVICTIFAFAGCSSCSKTRESEADYSAYTLSDVVMTQQGINTYKFELTADSAGDNAKVYLTERDKIKQNDVPVTTESAEVDGKLRYSFVADLNLSEEYYLWVKSDEKEVMLPVTAPSMFPSMETRVEGGAIFHFNYTYGVSWSSFCDPDGKSVYSSTEKVFDDTAMPVQSEIAITSGDCVIPAAQFDSTKYYYSVTTAKNGLLKIISSPVSLASDIKSQFTAIEAGIKTESKKPVLTVKATVKADTGIYLDEAVHLQLVVKSGTGDEIYGAEAEWGDGVATMKFDASLLIEENIWYDMCISWYGSIIMDVPKTFSSADVVASSTVKIEKYKYSITDWKAEDTTEEEAGLKIFFEKDTARYAEEFCVSYLPAITINEDEASLTVVVKLKDGVEEVPELAITAGDKNKLIAQEGVRQDDGSYLCTLSLSGLSLPDIYYDIRLCFGDVICELTKDECISNENFNKDYPTTSGKIFNFREYEGLLKIEYKEQ